MGADELGRFFVTGVTYASGEPRHLTAGSAEKTCLSRHVEYMRSCTVSGEPNFFSIDQRFRLETPGWRVLDYEGNLMREEEFEWHRERILKVSQMVKDREYPFSEDFIVESSGAVDVTLPVFAKVSALIGALRLGELCVDLQSLQQQRE